MDAAMVQILLWRWMADSDLSAAEICRLFADEIVTLQDEEGFQAFRDQINAGRAEMARLEKKHGGKIPKAKLKRMAEEQIRAAVATGVDPFSDALKGKH